MPDAPAPTALKVLEMARAGRFAEISERFAPQLRPMVPAEALRPPGTPRSGGGSAPSPPSAHRSAAGRARRDGGARPGGVRAGSVHAGHYRHRRRLAGGSAARTALGRGAHPALAAARLCGPARFDEEEVTVGTGPLAVPGTLTVPAPQGRHRYRELPSSCSAARERTTGTRPSGGTSRSRTSPGAWPVAASRYSASTRSPIPTAARWRRTAISRWPTSTFRTRSRRSDCSGSIPRWTPTGYSCWATAWAAPSPRASRWLNRPSPGWSSSPAAPSRCIGPPSARPVTWPRWSRRRRRPRSARSRR